MAEGAYKIGDLAQKLMASIEDDLEFDGCEVMDVAIVAAVKVPPDHELNSGEIDDTPEFFYRCAGPKEPWVKAGLLRQGVLAVEDGEGVDEPEPPK